MSPQDNKSLILRFVEEVQNQHKLELLEELVSPDYVDHSGRATPPNREGMKNFFELVFTAFPDARFEVHQQLSDGDKVMTHKTFHGTHNGPFMGMPPTGKAVTFDVMDVFTVAAGKIAEHWAVADEMGLMQQLGAVPPGNESN